MKRAKKVRFHDPLVDHPSCGRISAAASLRNSTEVPASDNPKTSEFSFFKKLKMHVVSDNSSKPLPGENNLSERSKTKNHNWGEPSTATNNGGEVMGRERVAKFLSSASSAELCAADLLISPQVVDSRRADKTGMIEEGNKSDESYFPVMTKERNDRDKDPRFSSPSKTSTSAGTDCFMTDATKLSSSKTGCVAGDLFSKKRRKLQGWVARTIFPQKNEEIKGFDVVSLLLDRLHPENSKTNQIETLKPRRDSRGANCQLNKIPKSDDRLRRSRTLPRKYIEREQPYLMDNGTSSYKGNELCGRHLTKTSAESTCFPTLECASQMLLGCRKRDVDPCCLSRTYIKKSSDNGSLETFSDVAAKSYGSVQPQNLRRMALQCEPLQEQVLDDDFSSIWYSRLDSPPSARKIFSSHPVSSSSCVISHGNESLYEYEKQDTGWMDCIEASNFNIQSDSAFVDSPEKCRSSAPASLVVSNQTNNDLEVFGVRQWSLDLPGWDVDKLTEGETTYGFNSTALMCYQQNPETKMVSNCLLSSCFLPIQGFVDDAENGFEAQNKHVYIRSCPPLGSPSKELIPANSSDLYLSASNHWLTSETCLTGEMVSERFCPYEEAIFSCVPVGNAYPSFPDCHEPITECSSPYLLEDDRDMQSLENKGFRFDSTISPFSCSHLSSSVELLRPSQLHRLQWRDTEADEFFDADDLLTQCFY